MTQQPSQQLVKAKLFSLDDRKYDIEFMFNPTQLDFTRGVKLNQPAGARSNKGQPKVSFAAPEPCVLTLSKVLFDTYEDGRDLLKDYIEPLIQAVKFLDSGAAGSPNSSTSRTPPASRFSSSTSQQAQNKRPPIYLFTWGAQQYLRCFVESFKYQLTLFLPDGTPVRATAALTLKEVDESAGPASPRTPENPDRTGDSRDKRSPRKA